MTPAMENAIQELLSAVDLLDRPQVAERSAHLAERISSGELLPPEAAKRVLGGLRRKRFFAAMQRVADALIHGGQGTPVVRRQYAQALIDQGALTGADAVLRDLARDPAERAEALGLLGRVYKQRYVDAVPCAGGAGARERDAAVLREAIEFYHEAYLENPAANYWHGINVAACVMRGRHDGVKDLAAPDAEGIAADLLARIQEKGEGAYAWEQATALEALVALGREDEAIGRAVRYTAQPDADAFEIASTLRQLEVMWCLDGTSGLGRLILPLLRGALLQRETGAVMLAPAEIREAAAEARGQAVRAALEKVLGADDFTSYDTYLAGARRARSVARIGREAGGRGDGTGFLIRGSDLADRFAGEDWLLLTNAHVVSTVALHRPAVFPDEAVVTFQALSMDSARGVRGYRIAELLAVSGPEELDFALVRLDSPVADLTDEDRCDVAQRLPIKDGKGRVYIIGHPSGGSLSYSIQDNLLLDYDERRLHYRAPTEGGSSGSPVYNARWQLIGLHHAGSSKMPRLDGTGVYGANEGIWIQAIRQALAA